MPESIGYTRVGLGWFDGFAIGLSVVSYSDENMPNNLKQIRNEFRLGILNILRDNIPHLFLIKISLKLF